MDPVQLLFGGPRHRGPEVLRVVMDPPWAIEVADRAPLAVVTVAVGLVSISGAAVPTTDLGAGETALISTSEPYVLSDREGRTPSIIIHPGQRCEDRHGRSLAEPLSQGIRTWGNSADGGTVFIVGVYERVGEAARLVLDELPPVLAVGREAMGSPVFDLLVDELAHPRPGQGLMLDRLVDLVAVSALRAWPDDQADRPPPWWAATGDPVVDTAVRLLQNNLAHRWTVAELAARVGVSRATMARRFSDLVGRSPMAFLTDARLTAAAELLDDPDATVGAIASTVGYGSGFALSAAFKRSRGISPTRYRRDRRDRRDRGAERGAAPSAAGQVDAG